MSNSTNETLHLISLSAADRDFRFETMAADWYTLLWSQRQNAFHIERHKHMMDSNRRAYSEDRSVDYVQLIVGTHDFCCRMADKLRGTLQHRALAQDTAAKAIKTAAQPAKESNCPNDRPFKDILNALDRQATALEYQRDKLAEAGNYDTMFSEADAEMLREAAALLETIQRSGTDSTPPAGGLACARAFPRERT